MRRPDSADVACEEWAVVMRELVGWTQPKMARDYLGSLRCTLAARRDLHHGARGKIDQRWPEFPFANRGRAATVTTVYKRLPESLQEILTAHYVATSPRSKSLRADLLGISVLMTAVAWLRFLRRDIRLSGEGSWRSLFLSKRRRAA